MSLLTMYSHIKELLVEFPELLRLWETTYRETIASTEVKDLLSGSISDKLQHTAFTRACETTSAKATFDSSLSSFSLSQQSKLASIATTLWNPLLAGSLSLMKVTTPTASKPASKSRPTPKPDVKVKKPTKMEARPSSTRPPPSIVVPRKHQTTPRKPPSSFVDTATVVTENVSNPQIYQDLEDYRATHPLLFEKFTYITCHVPSCSTCDAIFRNISLTKCETNGHDPCVPSGWFPHLGPKLWFKLVRHHYTGQLDFSELPSLSKGRIMSIRAYLDVHDDVANISDLSSIASACPISRTASWIETADREMSPSKRKCSSEPATSVIME